MTSRESPSPKRAVASTSVSATVRTEPECTPSSDSIANQPPMTSTVIDRGWTRTSVAGSVVGVRSAAFAMSSGRFPVPSDVTLPRCRIAAAGASDATIANSQKESDMGDNLSRKSVKDPVSPLHRYPCESGATGAAIREATAAA